MALVSSSVPIHFRAPEIGRRPAMRAFSRTLTVRSAASLGEIEEEPVGMAEDREEKEKVYVALGREYKEGKETLIWALQNTSREKMIVIVHVHRPAQFIPMMGAKFPVNRLTEQQVRTYRRAEQQKLNESLEEYLVLCAHAKVQADKLVIENDDVGKGLLEAITLHGITKLIMGAAADRNYSKRMKAPRSKIATSLQQQADPSCKLWFVCKGNLICTRDTSLDGTAVQQLPTASPSTEPNQMRSRSLPQHQTEALKWLASPLQKSRSTDCNSHQGGIMTELSPLTPIMSSEGSVNDSWEGISRNSHDSDPSTASARDEVLSSLASLPTSKDEESEKGSVMFYSSPSLEQEDVGIDNEIYQKLQHALKEANDLKHEAYRESCRRHKAEKEAIQTARKAKVSENLYTAELKQRKDMEVTLARENLELEKVKTQRDEIIQESRKAHKQKLELEHQVTDSERMVKEFKLKLTSAKTLLISLKREHEELQQERDNAVRETEELRRKKEEASPCTQGLMNFSEFTYCELEKATNSFDASLKIGEGGYGCVYKGFLRHTAVAIKMLNPQSTQGQAEFYQEVEILSRVRHPHLVTLIGTCPEAWALIYEYLPQGSLEDRLVCKDNSPPLPWQFRTRICAEICCALLFLHSNKRHTVVHGDLKPANILLDSNFISKLGDFGICRLLVQSNTTTTLCHRTNPKGTFAYMDPEFISTGELTRRSDIYSFGVIILRLLTGRPALGIIKDVKEVMEAGKLHEILDPLAGDWPFVQARQLAHLALRCCELKRKNRPDLSREVWRELEPMMKAASSMCSSMVAVGSVAKCSGSIPSHFICPIFQEIMRDPHIAADGFTYEAEAIKGWLDIGDDTSPMTNLKLAHRDTIPNHALRSAIQEWLQKQK